MNLSPEYTNVRIASPSANEAKFKELLEKAGLPFEVGVMGEKKGSVLVWSTGWNRSEVSDEEVGRGTEQAMDVVKKAYPGMKLKKLSGRENAFRIYPG